MNKYEHLEHDPVYAAKYATSRVSVRGNAAYSDYIARRMIDAVPVENRTRALDLMCGSGVMFSDLNKEFKDFIGVDSSPAMIDLVPAEFKNNAVLADASELPSDLGKFDAVFIRGGLHHEPEALGKIIGEATRVLNPGGRIVLWEPCADFGPVRMLREYVYKKSSHFDSAHERGLRAAEIEEQLARWNFKEVKTRRIGNLAYLMLFNSDASKVARLIGSLPFSGTIAKVLIVAENLWEKIPLFNKAGFNVFIEASAAESGRHRTAV